MRSDDGYNDFGHYYVGSGAGVVGSILVDGGRVGSVGAICPLPPSYLG
jgi:hypothetical protein